MVMGDRALVSVNQDVMVLKRLPAATEISEYAKERRAFLADDMRVIPQRLDRPHTFEEAVRSMTRVAIPRTFASPISGPDTVEWFIEATISQGHGGFISRHHRWKRDSGVGHKDRFVYEHEVMARAVEYLGTIDGVSLKTSVGVEFLLRRKQLLEEAVGENPESPSYEGANHYMGSAERPGGALLDLRLRAHVATERSREAAVFKEKRKAREVRGGGHGNKNKGKGKGNQGGGGGAPAASSNPWASAPARLCSQSSPAAVPPGRGSSAPHFVPPAVPPRVPWPRRNIPVEDSFTGQVCPIPPLPGPPPLCTGSGKKGKLRCRRGREVWSDAAEAVDALNMLYGVGFQNLPVGTTYPVGEMHSSIHARIMRRIVRRRPGHVPKPSAAARQLLGSRFGYMGDGTTVEPYDESGIASKGWLQGSAIGISSG